MFRINGLRQKGNITTVCLQGNYTYPKENEPQLVRVRHLGDNSWGIKRLRIQKSTNSSYYNIWSMANHETEFFVDGNSNNMDYSYQGKTSCIDGKWCTLMVFEKEGNNFYI